MKNVATLPTAHVRTDSGWGIKPQLEGIPDSLKQVKGWVLWSAKWKAGASKPDKVPCDPSGKPINMLDRQGWMTFAEVVKAYGDGTKFSGIGLVMQAFDTPMVGVDVDGCRDPDTGDLDERGEQLLSEGGTYVEVSPSGRGLRAYAHGDMGEFRMDGVEVYNQDSRRFLTVTGVALNDWAFDNVQPLSRGLRGILQQYRRGDERPNGGEAKAPLPDWTLDRTRGLLEALRDADPSRWDDEYEWMSKLVWPLHSQGEGDPEWMELAYEFSHDTDGVYGELQSRWERATADRSGGATLLTLIKEANDDPRVNFNTRMATPASAEDFPDLGSEDAGEQPKFDLSKAPKLNFSTAGIPVVEVPTANCRYTADIERELSRLGITVGDAIYKVAPAPEMVEDILAINEVSVLAGAPGSMKTMWGISLALALANGEETWFGQHLLEESSALWLAYEGANAVRKRIGGYAARNIEIQPRMALVTPRLVVTHPSFESYVYDMFCAMQRVNGIPPRWIVIDTFAQGTLDINENEASDVGPVMSKLQRLAQALQCHVTVIHHGTKNGSSLIRGSSAIEGAVDTVIGVSSDKATRLTTATVEKQRNMDSYGEQFVARMVLNDLSLFPWWNSQWGGKTRSAPMIEPQIHKATDGPMGLDAKYIPLKEAFLEAIAEAGGVCIDGGAYNTIMENWLAIAWEAENRELFSRGDRSGKEVDLGPVNRQRANRARAALVSDGQLSFSLGSGRGASVLSVEATRKEP